MVDPPGVRRVWMRAVVTTVGTTVEIFTWGHGVAPGAWWGSRSCALVCGPVRHGRFETRAVVRILCNCRLAKRSLSGQQLMGLACMKPLFAIALLAAAGCTGRI